jgi:two-component system LytT family response regulator
MSTEIRAVIVDDEANSRAVLRKLIETKCAGVTIAGMAGGYDEAIVLIPEIKPDVIFLDIQMPDGSGFDVLRKLGDLESEVIFVTSHNEYAVNAIRFNALDYLLKPTDVSELKETIERLRYRLEKKSEMKTQLASFLDHMEQGKKERKLPVHYNNQVLLLPLSKIMHIAGDGNYSRIVTDNKEEYVIGRTLKEIELYFEGSTQLIRARKDIIINADFLVSYTKTEPCIIEMQDKSIVEVSRRKRQEVLDYLRAVNR